MKPTRIGEWVKTWAEKSNIHCEYYFETQSTNDCAKNYAYNSLDPVVFVTETQTHGRGRGQNVWKNSDPGTALLCTWSFGLEAAPQPITTPLIGLALYRALSATMNPKDLSLKAPNDIFLGSKKAGGILVEALSEGSHHRLIVGIGLNVFAPPSLDTATALKGLTTQAIDQDAFCSFLNVLFVEFTQVLNECTTPELSPAARDELLLALNKFPGLKSGYSRVEADGSLRTPTQLISWSEL